MARAKIISKGGPDKIIVRRKPIQKRALMDAGEFWHERFLPLHFDQSAFFRYRGPETYRPRAASYNKRKRTLFGHNAPLVFSGTLKRMVSRERRVTGTSKRATVNLRGPRYLQPFKRNARDHDKAKELAATHPQEERMLGRMLKKNMEAEFNRLSRRTTIERIA